MAMMRARVAPLAFRRAGLWWSAGGLAAIALLVVATSAEPLLAGGFLLGAAVVVGLLALLGRGIARAAAALGIDVAALSRGRAPVCRSCLDWSERRTHLAGSLGRALLARFEAEGWARRDPASRAVRFSPDGRRRFDALFPA